MHNQSSPIPKKLLLLLSLGALLRLGCFVLGPPPQVEADAAGYVRLAKQLLEEGRYGHPDQDAERPPLYPFLLALCFLLSLSDRGVILIQLLLNLLTSIPLFLLARRFHGERTALFLAGAFCFYPPSMIWSFQLLTETLFALLIVCGVTITLLGRPLPAAPFYAAAILTRPEFVLPLATFYLCLVRIGRGDPRRLALAFSLVGLMVLPWIVRGYLVHERWYFVSTIGGITFYNSVVPPPQGFSFVGTQGINKEEIPPHFADRDRFFLRAGLAAVRQDPLHFLRLIPAKIALFFYPLDGRWYPIPLGSKYNWAFGSLLLLLLCFPRWSLQGERQAILGLLAGQIILCVFFYGSPRFRLGYEPLLLYLALPNLLHAWHTWRWRFLAPFVLIQVGLLLVLARL